MELDRHGYARVEDHLRTTAEDVFAAEDVTSRRVLASHARHDGCVAATNAVDGPSAHQVERHSHSSVAVTDLAAFIRHTAEGAVEPTKLRAPGTERLWIRPGRCSRCLRSAMFASRWMWGDVTKAV